MNIAMTPDQFQSNAQAWINAGIAIVGALGGLAAAVVVLAPKLAAAKAAIEELKGRQDRQSAKLDSQQQQITTVALAVPPTVSNSATVPPVVKDSLTTQPETKTP